MSFILDALQKSERERNAGQAPALDEALTRPLPEPRRQRRDQETALMVKTGLGVTAVFLIAGLTWWLLSRSSAPAPADTDTTVVAETPAAPPAAELPPPPATAMRVDPERLQAPIAAADLGPEAASLDELLDETPEAAAEMPPPVDAPALTATPAETAPPPEEAPPPPRPAASADARSLKDMPPSFRTEFPALSIQVHVFDANPLRRFVLVNGKKYRETDTLVEGPRVVEIVPEGLIVEHRGTRVLIEMPR